MPETLHVVSIGDSLAYGAGDESGGGIAGRLDAELRQRGVSDVETVNLGVNGAQTADVLRKLEQKRCDFIVANEAAVGFGGDDNVATLVGPGGDEALPKMSKRELADRILDRVLALLAGPVKPGSPKRRRPRARRPARRPKGR